MQNKETQTQYVDSTLKKKFRLVDILNMFTVVGFTFLMLGIIMLVAVPPNITPTENALDKQTVQSELVSVKPHTEKESEKSNDKAGSGQSVWAAKTKYLAEYECTLDGAPHRWSIDGNTPDPPQTRKDTFYKTKDGWTEIRPMDNTIKIIMTLVFIAVALLGAGFTAIGIRFRDTFKP